MQLRKQKEKENRKMNYLNSKEVSPKHIMEVVEAGQRAGRGRFKETGRKTDLGREINIPKGQRNPTRS